MDYSGKVIQSLWDVDSSARHIYLSVFPEDNRTIAIIAWLHENDELFSTIRDKLSRLKESEKKNYINNTIPIIAENLAVKPSAWDKMSIQAKQEFEILFWGTIGVEKIDREINRFMAPGFDLFSL